MEEENKNLEVVDIEKKIKNKIYNEEFDPGSG